MFHFNPAKVNLDKEIGRGAFGAIYPYQKNPEDDRWAVKVLTAPNDELVNQIQEIVLGFSCNHPNVLPVKAFNLAFNEKEHKWNIYIKLPLMAQNLRSKLTERSKAQEPFSEAEIVKYFYDITSGLIYLHRRKIAHRDIKLENILLDKEGVAKIADLGIGKFMEDETSYFAAEKAGTALYTAPEVLETDAKLKKKELYQADAWSLGIAIAELCLLKTRIVNAFWSGERKEAELAEQIKKLEGQYSSTLVNLLLGLLQCKPAKRTSIEEAYAFLRENYSEVIGLNIREKGVQTDEELYEERKFDKIQESLRKSKLVRQSSGNSLEIVQESLQILWGELFDFQANQKDQLLKITLQEGANGITDQKLKEMLLDLDKQIEEIECKDLQSLTLDLKQNSSISGTAWEDLSLKHCVDVKKFSIEALKCANLTASGAKSIVECIGSSHPQIENLHLSFSHCGNIDDAFLTEMSLQFEKNLKHIHHLNLQFKNCAKITDAGIKSLICSASSNLNLTTFLLDMEHTKITDDSIRTLGKQFDSGLKNLANFQFWLYKNPITDGAAIYLIQQIAKNLKNLKMLGICLPGSNVTDLTVKEMTEQFRTRLMDLEYVNLAFRACDISEAATLDLVSQMGISLQKLRSVRIGLSECGRLSDKVIDEFSKHFRLNFKSCNKIHLSFGRIGKITKQALLNLLKQISTKPIQDLTLDLFGLTQLNAVACQEIASQIKTHFQSLQSLTLYFDGLKLNEQTKAFIKKSLEHIPTLQLEF